MTFFVSTVALVVLIAGLFIRSILRHGRLERERPEALARVGAPLGLAVVSTEQHEDNAEDRRLLRGTSLAAAVEEMDGGLAEGVAGIVQGWEVRLGDFYLTQLAGRMPSEMHTVLIVTARHGRLPRFFLQPVSTATRPEMILGCAEAERYAERELPDSIAGMSLQIHQADERWVVDALLTAEGLELITGVDGSVLAIEGVGDRLLVRTPRQLVPEVELVSFLQRGVKLAERLRHEAPYRG